MILEKADTLFELQMCDKYMCILLFFSFNRPSLSMMHLVDSYDNDPPFYASFMARRTDSFKEVFLNEVSSTLSKLRSGKKNIQVNLINSHRNIDESNNISGNDIVAETANMGKSQQQLVDLDMP